MQSYLLVFNLVKFGAFLHFLGLSGLFLGDGLNQELEESSHVRNTLKSVELQSVIDSKNLSKMEKAISKVDDKKLLIAARKVMNNLQKHTATLDSLKDMPMPEQFRSKMMESSELIAENIEKVKPLIDRIQHSI